MNKTKPSERVTIKANICKNIRISIGFPINVGDHKINRLSVRYVIDPSSFEPPQKQVVVRKSLDHKEESDSIQICFQFFSMTFSKANKVATNFVIKGVLYQY